MCRAVKLFGGMPAWRFIAAPYVAALLANSQMLPVHAQSEALLTSSEQVVEGLSVIQMGAQSGSPRGQQRARAGHSLHLGPVVVEGWTVTGALVSPPQDRDASTA